ncbi:unnamed protein product [Orchesella dallaii]|uniref:Uncharacterized protein n=1 Tax=Orchesella dallaii TaxID=48710 RepID=A0ABP1RJY2_9HEXA
MRMETSSNSIETILPQLSWLLGFEECSNFILLNDHINILPLTNIHIVAFSLLPLVIFQRKFRNCTSMKSLRTNCRTISLIDGVHKGNKINEKFFVNAQITNKFANMGGFKHILFLVMPYTQGPVFTPYPGFLTHLSSINHPVIPLRVYYEFFRDQDSNLSSIVVVDKVVEVLFICRFCKVYNPLSSSYPFIDYSVKCDLTQGCRMEIQEIYKNVTGDGKYLHYYYSEVMFDELNMTFTSRTMQAFLKKNPTLFQLVMMTVHKSIPGIPRNSYSSNYGSPWIRSDFTLETSLAHEDQESVPLERIYYNFLTCHGKNSAVDFYAYIGVFDGVVWLLLILCMGSILFGAISISNSWLETVIKMLGLLVGNASLNASIFRSEKMRVLLAIWILTALVIINFYSSANTATFVVPQRTHRIGSILESGEGFSIFSFVKNPVPKDQSEMNLNVTYLPFDTEFGDDVYYWMKSRYVLQNNKFVGDFESGNLTNASNMFNLQLLQKILQIYRMIQPIFSPQSNKTDGRASQVMELLKNCHKSIFVSTSSKINNLETQFRHSRIPLPIYKGKNEFIPRYFVVTYEKRAGSYLKKQLNYFMVSGQNVFWQKLLERVSTNVNTSSFDTDKEETPLSLKSNFVSILYILVAGGGLSMVLLWFEVFFGIMRRRCTFVCSASKEPLTKIIETDTRTLLK